MGMCGFLAQIVGEIADRRKFSLTYCAGNEMISSRAIILNGRSKSDVSIEMLSDMGTGFLRGLNGELPSLNSSGDICWYCYALVS